MIRIICVIHSLQAGGMERVMSELMDDFSKNPEIELHLILYGINREVFYPIPEGITVHTPSFQFNNKFRVFHTLRTAFFIRSKIRSLKASSILSFGEVWNSFILISLIGLKVPVFISDRMQPDKNFSRIQDLIKTLLYPLSAGIIAQTQKAKEIFEKKIRHNNITVIGNPIRVIKSLPDSRKENIVLTVGRLIESKHHFELIKLFVKINNPNWKLVIVGGDAIKQKNKIKLEMLIEELNAQQLVELMGSRKDVDSFYAKSKLFAFTSSSEGFPNVVGEALSSGLPVVSFDCIAGPSDMIVDGENGFLIDLFDYKKFQNNLELLMLNDELRKTQSLFAKRSMLKFEKSFIANKFLNVLTNKKHEVSSN